MRLIFTCLLLACTFLCFSQATAKRQNIYFIKAGRYVSTRDSADYIRIVSEPDSGLSLFTVQEFLPNGKLFKSGYSKTVEHPAYEGVLTLFYENGKRRSMINYQNGVITYQVSYYPNGKLQAYLEYSNELSPLDGDHQYKIVTFNDSSGHSLVVDGNGHYRGPDALTERWQEGDVKNGLKEGIWTGKWEEDHTTFEEQYNNGKLLKGECKTFYGKTYTYTLAAQPASVNDIEKIMARLNSDAARHKVGSAGMVIVNCMIDSKGIVTDFSIRRSLSAEADNTAVYIAKRILSNVSVIPAILNGHPVNTYYGFQINFAN